MAQRLWEKGFSNLFKKNVPTAEVETPERYLELARRCMKYVERKSSQSASSSLQFNNGQCQYLANKLRESLSDVERLWARPSSSEIDVKGVEIMKLLWRCAREVESFIEVNHKNTSVQAAIVSANTMEYVCQLSADLEFCKLVIPNYFSTLKPSFKALHQYEHSLTKSASFKLMVSQDQMTFYQTILEKVGTLAKTSNDELKLAQCLAKRLSQHLSGSVELDCWKIQFSSLVPGQRLGSGSAGTVRKSKWMGEEVAEKVFQGADHASFRNEVQILAGLAHPNIVPLIGYAEDRNRCIIVMELMDGDLSSFMEDRLRQNHNRLEVPFSDFEAVDMMSQIAEGMRYLHEKRVVHRDLKALNILVKRRKDIKGEDVVYAAKVADFGLSKTRESSSSYSCLTANIGTTRWMAPELLPPGEDDLAARTSNLDSELNHAFKVDVYSFGMVCYEILTGQVPFSSISSLVEVKKMVLKGERPELPERCPESLRQLICSCWDTDPTRRSCFEDICRNLRRVKCLMMLGSSVPAMEQSNQAAKLYSLADIRAATQNYKIKIGEGRVGPVYYGKLPTGKEVAVKVSDAYSDVNEFYSEVQLLSRVHHKNLVRLVGYCLEDKSQMRVYEFLNRGTVREHLYGSTLAMEEPLDWKTRLDVAFNSAQGLEYLHNGCLPRVIHGNVKSSNILLTDEYLAKVADFGLPNLVPEEGFVKTTADYVDPEYWSTLYCTEKSDVYSFGVVMLELLCGRQPIDITLENRSDWNIVEKVRTALRAGDIDSILDPAVKRCHPNMDSVWKMAEIAIQSVEPMGIHRPYMTDVFKELREAIQLELGYSAS